MNGKKNKIPRIICVGSNIESDIALRNLINHEANIVGVVTRPPGEAGNISDYVDLHDFCKANNIETVDTKDINSDITLSEIRKIKPDYIFILGWSQIFKKELLSIPTNCIIGSHPSELPYGRGRAPVPWTILENIKTSAVSFFELDAGIDSGKLLHQEFFDIPENSYAIDVYKLVANSLANGFTLLYKNILENKLQYIECSNVPTTYRSKRSPEDGFINFNQNAEEISKLIRAVSYPYPGAYTYYNNKLIKVWKCSLENIPIYSAIPGQILKKNNNSLLVYAKKSSIWLKDLTDYTGSRIEYSDFKIGSKFGYRVDDEIFNIKKEIEKLKNIFNNE